MKRSLPTVVVGVMDSKQTVKTAQGKELENTDRDKEIKLLPTNWPKDARFVDFKQSTLVN